jgi:hypothetical protein
LEVGLAFYFFYLINKKHLVFFFFKPHYLMVHGSANLGKLVFFGFLNSLFLFLKSTLLDTWYLATTLYKGWHVFRLFS